jgi:magnesium-transporting ATPase (P-type)
VPEGLLPTVTLSLAMATQRMAKKNALVRHLPAVETLGAATVICSDKTGTLTQNRMSVRQVYFAGELVEMGVGDSPNPSGKTDTSIPFVLSLSKERTALQTDDIHPSTTPLVLSGVEGSGRTDILNDAAPLYAIMRHCHDLRRVERDGKTEWQGDPMEVALLESTPEGTTHPRIGEIPFDAERRRMSVVCDTPQGRMLYCKGAPENVLPLCGAMLRQGESIPLDDAGRAELLALQEQMTERGLRVLALAYRALPPHGEQQESELVFAGLIGLADPPRPGVTEAITTCHGAGIRVIMVTGDHPRTASALARETGLAAQPLAVTGDRLRAMSDADLQLLLDEPGLIFARTSPDQKMRIVQALQRRGEIVAVTGDGVNDAPALKCADIGIAMGISGTDVAKEAADIVLLDDHFATIVAAIEEGRAVYDNVRKFLTYILTSNIPEMVPYLAFVLFKIPLPLTIIQILAVDLGTDMLPALALGAEKPDPDVMRRPPRPRSERLLSWGMLARAYLFLGPLEALAGMAAFFFVLHGGGWPPGGELSHIDPLYLQATTACLAAIIAMQVVNVLLCRHPTRSAFGRGHRYNRMIAWGIAFELLLLALIVYSPWGNALFGAAPLDAAVWWFILPFGLGMLLLEEARKAVARWRNEQKPGG